MKYKVFPRDKNQYTLKNAYGTLFKIEAVGKWQMLRGIEGELQKSVRDNTHINETCVYRTASWYNEKSKNKGIQKRQVQARTTGALNNCMSRNMCLPFIQ